MYRIRDRSLVVEATGLSEWERRELKRLGDHYQLSRSKVAALAIRNWLLNPEVRVLAPLRGPRKREDSNTSGSDSRAEESSEGTQ